MRKYYGDRDNYKHITVHCSYLFFYNPNFFPSCHRREYYLYLYKFQQIIDINKQSFHIINTNVPYIAPTEQQRTSHGWERPWKHCVLTQTEW